MFPSKIEFTVANKNVDFEVHGTLKDYVKFPCACGGNGDVRATGTVKIK